MEFPLGNIYVISMSLYLALRAIDGPLFAIHSLACVAASLLEPALTYHVIRTSVHCVFVPKVLVAVLVPALHTILLTCTLYSCVQFLVGTG